MSMPFYVAPEQMMKDKADYARKGIARGRSLMGVVYADGILLAADNPSRTLHKVSEIYDRIAFAGAGKYSEYDQLRVAGVRHADTKGYAYSREDVDARSLANAYAQLIGQVFTHDVKPLEVEILVAEVGPSQDGPGQEGPRDASAREAIGGDRLYHVLYDGTVVDEDHLSVLGGESEGIQERMESTYEEGWSLADALKGAVAALAGQERTIEPSDLEVAVLERARERRAFRRIEDDELLSLLG
ncbi:MAG: proteasome subunit alpha [Actinomycetota bacterium]|nr:proteasome subunit alpha [Actinomycetota bacterium]